MASTDRYVCSEYEKQHTMELLISVRKECHHEMEKNGIRRARLGTYISDEKNKKRGICKVPEECTVRKKQHEGAKHYTNGI